MPQCMNTFRRQPHARKAVCALLGEAPRTRHALTPRAAALQRPAAAEAGAHLELVVVVFDAQAERLGVYSWTEMCRWVMTVSYPVGEHLPT